MSPETPSGDSSPRRRKKRLGAWLVGLSAVAILGVAVLWVLVHSVPWMGPLVANALRSILGTDRVAALEDFVYAIEDRVNRVVKSEEPPKSYWKVPPKADPPPVAVAAVSSVPLPESEPPRIFSLPNPGPLHDGLAAEGDGVWVPMVDPRRPDESARTLKTLIHPDKSRGWAELFVVAIDLETVSVELVPGYQEPRTERPEAADYPRPAKIPESAYPNLLGAFNGGFMAEHGHYGFLLDGVVFLEPKPDSCSVVRFRDGSYDVATWSKLAERQSEMLWARQGPWCMVEEGTLHPSLQGGHNRKFGATLDGNTVIRRSAIGINREKTVLFAGITNHTTAKALAVGMKHAGADVVVQMDVNWSYPKFVTYEPDAAGKLHPIALAEGFEFNDKLYLRERSMRDFFYLLAKDAKSVPTEEKALGAP